MAKCITPFYKKGDTTIPLPCGRCPMCIKRRVSGWSFRLMKEGDKHALSFFVTLTYNTEHVPITEKGFMSLNKQDIQNFMKRLRKNSFIKIQEKKIYAKIKYYAAGEYGTKFGRPHYHILLFGADQRSIIQAWRHPETLKAIGDVHFGNIEEASIGYSLKYISKEKKVPIHANDDRVPEFALMSKDLGLATLNQKQLHGT